jgi:hypothetical protein
MMLDKVGAWMAGRAVASFHYSVVDDDLHELLNAFRNTGAGQQDTTKSLTYS